MWIMTSYGILMPAVRPGYEDLALPLQVRARDRSTLTILRQAIIDKGLPCTKVHSTPEMDYDFRVYTTHDAFARVMAAEIRHIDYEKFKPTTIWSHLHELYNEIWHVVFTHYSRRNRLHKKGKRNVTA